MKTMLVSEFKAKCFAALKEVQRTREPMLITLRGKPLATVQRPRQDRHDRRLGHAAVKMLLDTHVWIWTQEQPERLGPRTKRLLTGREHENTVCPISTLVIARLVAAGDIRLSIPLAQWVALSMADLAAQTVSVSHEISIEAYALPGTFHRDSADRLLVAAARRNESTLVTADDRILSYPHVRTHDAETGLTPLFARRCEANLARS